MQKNKLLLLSSIFFTLLAPTTIYAVASSTPFPTGTPISEEASVNQITENLKSRLKETINSEENTEDQAPTNRAFVGQIQDVIQKTLILNTKDGKKQVILTEDTNILRSPGNATIKPDSIRLEDYIIAIGTLKDDDVIEGKRLIISTTPLTDTTKTTGYGQITEIAKSTITLTSLGEDIVLDINSDTLIKTKENPSLELSELELNQRVIFTAYQRDEDKIATVLMLVK